MVTQYNEGNVALVQIMCNMSTTQGDMALVQNMWYFDLEMRGQ